MNPMQDIVFEEKTDVVVGHLILHQVKSYAKKRPKTKYNTADMHVS